MKLIGESDLSPALKPAERIAVLASAEPMVKDLTKTIVEASVVKAYGTIIAIKQLKDLPEEDQDFFIDYVTKVVKESFTTYKLADIQQACEMWARGELFSDKDLNQLSAENFFKAIMRYNELVRKEAIHKQKAFEEKKEKEAEEAKKEEGKAKFEQSIIEVYERFPIGFKTLNKGSLSAVYRYLDKLGLISMGVARKKEIFNAVLKIKDRTKFMRKGLLDITAKELSEYRALYIVFLEMKEFGIDLKEEISTAKIKKVNEEDKQ